MPTPTWEQAERFISTTGLAAFIVLMGMSFLVLMIRAVWQFLKPQITAWFQKQLGWFDKQIELVEQLIARMHSSDEYEQSKRKAFISLGRAVHAGAPDDKQPAVKQHIDDMRMHLNEGEED